MYEPCTGLENISQFEGAEIPFECPSMSIQDFQVLLFMVGIVLLVRAICSVRLKAREIKDQ